MSKKGAQNEHRRPILNHWDKAGLRPARPRMGSWGRESVEAVFVTNRGIQDTAWESAHFSLQTLFVTNGGIQPTRCLDFKSESASEFWFRAHVHLIRNVIIGWQNPQIYITCPNINFVYSPARATPIWRIPKTFRDRRENVQNLCRYQQMWATMEKLITSQ